MITKWNSRRMMASYFYIEPFLYSIPKKLLENEKYDTFITIFKIIIYKL